ncbi:MAG TPA: NADP-dependent malic enzyme [Elusimicrobiales bacterium]|nr:NADP-dependent malic enzyme [Elusimicrobiales bacterium]
MAKINLELNNLDTFFPGYSGEKLARAKTLFLKELSFAIHKFYSGKMTTIPKAGLYGFNWFNVYYTPGVSAVSTAIRDDNQLSFELSNRANTVLVLSDSTRVLGDGNCTPSGGLGVMEGKAFLMKYLGGIDAYPVCIDSRDKKGVCTPQKIIDFVKMSAPSFAAVNLEDISQPNCYEVLDTLKKECSIPVWHDDAQGTACVILAGLINALKLAKKNINKIKLVMLGAGASNTTIARLIIKAGAKSKNIIIFDSKGGLHKNRKDIFKDKRFYPKWELCKSTNPKKISDIETAIKGADVLIALSKPGPNVVKPSWIKLMNKKSIVFACANPVPEIYPYAAKKAGAFIVATGRGDFPNQINNSIGFPGILKGALLVRASKITDEMAISASYAIAETAQKRGIKPNNIVPLMTEWKVFANTAKAVGLTAIKQGIAEKKLSGNAIYKKAYEDIKLARKSFELLMNAGIIKKPPLKLVKNALKKVTDKLK